VRGVAHQREIVRNERGCNSILGADGLLVTNLILSSINLHHAIADNALREIFVRRPDANLLHTLIFRSKMGRGCERIVSLKLDHWPHSDTHRSQRLFQWMKLREQRSFNSSTGFIAQPEIISKR